MTRRETQKAAQQLMDLLERQDLSLVTAESCTAGLVASTLSKAKGAGDRLHGGYVVYTKAHKHRALGLSAQMLKESGAVTKSVAIQMATHALERSKADVSVATTGVAEPKPDEDGNAVGTLFLAAVRRGGKCKVERHRLTGVSPENFRRTAVSKAIELAIKVTKARRAGSVARDIRRSASGTGGKKKGAV